MSNTSHATLATADHEALVSAAELRRMRGYSLADLAETCGLTVQEIARIESGEQVAAAYLRRIAGALRCPVQSMREYRRIAS